MTVWVDHGPMDQPDLIGTVGAGIVADSATRFRALLRRQFLAVPSTFVWQLPHSMERVGDPA